MNSEFVTMISILSLESSSHKHSIDNSCDLKLKCSLCSIGKKGALKNDNYGKSCQQERRMSTLYKKCHLRVFSTRSSFLLRWVCSLLFWRTQYRARPEKNLKFSQSFWSWKLRRSWRVSLGKLTLSNYVISNIFSRLSWDSINELVNEVLVRITIWWFLSCWQ